MLKSYLTIALRTLRKHRGFTFINVAGLGLGMACCLLLFLFVRDELSYDRFHENADRLYRLNKVVTPQEGGTERHAITSGLMGPTLAEEYSEVTQAVRVLPWFDEVLLSRGDTHLPVAQVVFADSNFFQVFDFRLLRGGPATALAAPFSLVLTESTARRLFGEADPVGQTLAGLGERDYTVTGLAADAPANAHLSFDALVSWSTTGESGLAFGWMNNWLTQVNFTYLLLAPGAEAAALEAKLPGFMQRHFAERAEQYQLYLQPSTDLYLHSSDLLHTRGVRQGNAAYVYLFSAIAGLILLIACINFMNLATARATKRAREVGVRKALGAHRGQLARQFFGESVLLAGLALVLALVLVETVLPFFNAFTGKALHLDLGDPLVLPLLVGITLFVGAAAGSYPALVLSRFRPVDVLKGARLGTAQGALPRRVLVTAQFAISIILIVGTLVVYRQMAFVQTQNLGFEQERVVTLPIGGTGAAEQYAAFRQEVLKHPEITHAAASDRVPGGTTIGFGLRPEGKPDDEAWTANAIRLHDAGFLDTYGMEIVAGRGFAEGRAGDSSAVVINEALARSLGWRDPIGKRLDVPGELENGTVIGVVRNFHYESLHHAIDPLVLFLLPRRGELSLRLTGRDVPGTLAFLQETWERFEPRHAFAYAFLDASFDTFYRAERRLMQTLGLFAVLAILIACLGLFGLAAFTAEQRTKEIGIRKVMGATVPGVVALLSKDFLRLVGFAFAVAVPLAYLATSRWLDAFAYRAELSLWLFVLAGGLALLIAFLTVSYQSLKAALADPVKALRYE